MGENKRAVIVGVPGVGKTTVITRASEILSVQGHKTAVVVFGSIMFDEARKIGVKNRDEMRKMSVEEQRRFQDTAAQRISEMKDDIVLVDTHLFINTTEGYYPGLPMRLLNVMKPTNIVMVAADPQEILHRRKDDVTRQRDLASAESIRCDLEISKVMVASCSILIGSPFAIIMNHEDKIDEAASGIVKVLTGERESEIRKQ